jgi:WD40 repeat protein
MSPLTLTPRTLPVLFVLLIGAATALGAEPRLDFYGDPLPEGAIARLGSTRLRPGGSVTHLVFSPDGKRLASWSESGLSIWEAETGRELRHVELTRDSATLYALAWPKPGLGVAVLDLQAGIYVLNFTDEKPIPPPGKPTKRPKDIAELDEPYGFTVSPDGKYLAAGRHTDQGQDRPIDLWELTANKPLAELKRVREIGAQPGIYPSLRFTSDGKSIVAAGQSVVPGPDTLCVWEVETGKVRKRLAVPRPRRALTGGKLRAVLAVSPDGKMLAVSAADGPVTLIDLDGEAKPRELIGPQGITEEYKGMTALALSPDGRFIVTAGRDSVIRQWDVKTLKEIRILAQPPVPFFEAIEFSPDGKRVAAAGGDGLIRIWDPETGNELLPPVGHTFMVWQAAATADGKTAVTGSGDGTLRVWELETGRERSRIANPLGFSGLTMLPDGKALLAATSEGVRAWEPATGKPLTVQGDLAKATGLLWPISADGKTLLTSKEGTVFWWDWPAGRLRRKIEPDPKLGRPYCVGASLSADSRLLALAVAGHCDGVRGIITETLDAASGKRLARLKKTAPDESVLHAFLPDGHSLAVIGERAYKGVGSLASPVETLGLWDPLTGKLRRAFAAPKTDSRLVHGLAVSPNGCALATGENDRSILVFETATGQVRRRLVGHRASIDSVTFTPDGRRLITTSHDQTALVWDMTFGANGSKPVRLSPTDRDKAWKALAATAAAPAYEVVVRLAADPDGSVLLVKKHIQPAPAIDGAVLDKLIDGLNNDRFAVRERAAAELDRLGKTVVGAVRARFDADSSPEVRERLAKFLEQHDRDEFTAEELRQERALELLEQIGTAEAREVLRELSKGEKTARLTRQADAALKRLEGQEK